MLCRQQISFEQFAATECHKPLDPTPMDTPHTLYKGVHRLLCPPSHVPLSSCNWNSHCFRLFVLFEVMVQLCWHASLVQELILLSIRLLEQSTYIYFTKKKGCVFDERNFIFFSIRKEPFHFFPISVCWAPILQLFRRCPGNNYCRHVAGILMIIGKPPGLVGAEQPVCQAKKILQAILRIENNFGGIYSSSQELKQITRNWKFLLHC